MLRANRKAQLVKPKRQNLVVIELADNKRRVPDKPHLYILRTQKSPEQIFETLKSGTGPKWILGTPKKLRMDLLPNHRPTTKLKVAKDRLKILKSDLARRGYAINGDSTTWRVYVLNIDADSERPIKDRGKRGEVLYVGQTSASLEKRLAQHRGEEVSKKGKYIGSPKLKGRNPTSNKGFTPTRVLFTEEDAIAFETKTHKKLEALGYKVLGDVHEN